MTDSQTRRLAAILAADVVGYSRLMGADEAGVMAALRRLRAEVFDPLVTAHRGRIVKLMGDGTLVEFASVVDAVTCAAGIQAALAERDADVPGAERLVLRIGVNLGDVMVEGDDIYGDGVNVAARLEALAEPGGICVSRTVADHVRGKTPFGFQNLGARQVKNIAEPVEVFRLVPDAGAGAMQGGKRRRWPLAAAGVAVLAMLAGGLFWFGSGQSAIEPADEARMAFPLPDKPSIVVLPFDDISPDAGQESFAAGMTEDLITDLSKIGELFVIARNSSFAYEGREVAIRTVAEELGVRYVLEGSVRRAGDTLRVNAQLVDATTGGHVWADRFDGSTGDIFAVQDAFVVKIVNALELTLTDRERGEIARVETEIPDARAAFQRGWELYSRFNERDNDASIPHFERAIELDPEYGRAYGALALVHLRGVLFHHWAQFLDATEMHLGRFPDHLNAAIEHDSSLIYVIRAIMHLNLRDTRSPLQEGGAIGQALEQAARAIEVQPNDPEAHLVMAWALIADERPDEALGFIETAMRLDPGYPSHYALFAAAAHYALGDLDKAVAALEAGHARDPEAVELMPALAAMLALTGRREEANALFQQWQPGADAETRTWAADKYFFIVRWEGASLPLNQRLQDGLRLASLPLATTVESLRHALGDRMSRESYVDARQLGWFGPDAAVAVAELIGALGAPYPLVRREAAIALGKIGPGARSAIPALEAKVDVPLLGAHARAALAKIRGE